jgi:hypothetical protein
MQNWGSLKRLQSFFFFFLISKLHMHLVGLEPMVSPSTLLQREEVPFELKLIGLESFSDRNDIKVTQKGFEIVLDDVKT